MYDVIVIGQDISSLLSAIRSAQLGKKTVLLSERAPSDRIVFFDYSFELDPFPWPVIASMEYEPSYSYLKAFDSPEPRDGLFQCGFQIVHPGHRIDFPTGKYAYLKELTREFPERSLEIGKFLGAAESADRVFRSLLPLVRNSRMFPGIVKITPKLSRNLVSWFINTKFIREAPELGAILGAQYRTFSNSCPTEGLPLACAYHLGFSLNGGSSQLRKKWEIIAELRDILSSFGGELIRDCSVRRVLSGREIEVVIEAQQQPGNLSGRALILSAKWSGMHVIQDDKISKWVKRHARLDEKVFYPFTLHLGANEGCLPERMAENVVVLTGGTLDRPVAGCDSILVHAGRSGDPECAPAGKRALSATVFLEESPREIEDDRIDLLPGMILDRLEFFLPFLKENIDKFDPAMSIDLSRNYQGVVNRKCASRGGFLGIPIFADNMPKRNIAITGGELFPGLGFEGEIISGIDAANRISGGK